MMMFLLLLLAVGSGAVPLQDTAEVRESSCGYKSCHKPTPGFLNVHIVPHTHDDVGWLKTVDQYYYGSRNNIQKAGVQYILDSVIKELWEDPKRRFIYVETAFFWKWWVRQPSSIQNKVHTLVQQGRLQFVGGAWSMNDEAATHYQSTVDQFTWGLSKLNKTFGACGMPHVGWQIDPFGHSREFASLLAGMGYDGLFLGRIDYQDKASRLAQKNMEMVWRGDDSLGKSSDIFTGVLYNTYSPPPGFCFDVLCSDEPIVDDPNSPIYNVEEKVLKFVEICTNMSKTYRTNNILVTMGEDFNYQDAAMWFTNLDKLISYTNLKAAQDSLNVTLFYSTPDCYLNAVRQANPTLPTKKDDFFPYASDPNAYWTGYFTSRPTTKYFEREANSYLQMVKQLQVLGDLEKHNIFVLDELKSAMGVMQHHDAITGTEKQHVARDYVRLLAHALRDASIVATQAVNKFTMVNGDSLKSPILDLQRCHINESRCFVTENNDKFIVTLYNPLGWSVVEPIRIPVPDANYTIYGPDGKAIDYQKVTIPHAIRNIPSRNSKSTHELVFIIELKPLSYKNLYFEKTTKLHTILRAKREITDSIKHAAIDYKETGLPEIPEIDNLNTNKYKLDKISEFPTTFDDNIGNYRSISDDQNNNGNNKYLNDLEKFLNDNMEEQAQLKKKYPQLDEKEIRMMNDQPNVPNVDNNLEFENEFFKVNIDKTSGVKSVQFPNSAPINISINMYYYTGAIGNNEVPLNRSSGAYIFRPTNNDPIGLSATNNEVIQGDIVTEFRTNLSPNGYLNTRMYNNLYYLEVDWQVGPIPIEDNTGKEYVIRYETNLINNGEFYTDSNGRQVLKRKLNYRPQYDVKISEPVAGNYYPVTNEIYIENDNDRVTVLPDRAEGGTSLVEGTVELMLHRRLLHDDAFGVGEALNETINDLGLVSRGTQRMLVLKQDDFNRKSIISYHLRPILLFSDATNIKLDDYLKLKNDYSWMVKHLPNGLHLLTLEPWGDQLLIRIENYLNKSEFSDIEIDLSEVFVNIEINNIRETTLAANKWKDEHIAWEWEKEKEFERDTKRIFNNNGLKVKLSAKQIKTFIVDYTVKN